MEKKEDDRRWNEWGDKRSCERKNEEKMRA